MSQAGCEWRGSVEKAMSGIAAAGVRPEKELLLACAATRADAERAGRIRALVRRGLDWAYLVASAAEEGVTPLLFWQLKAACPEDVPQAWREQLHEEYRKNIIRNLFLTAELLKILDGFRADGISAVPYKGPVLAAQAYGELAFRHFDDLDIVLRQRDVAKAHEWLTSRGYRAAIPRAAVREMPARKIPGQYLFRRDAGDSIVEIHTERTLRYFPTPLELDSLAQRLRPVSLCGCEVLTFSSEDALPILCVHGSKHFWERLSWVADIAELTQISGGLDWDATVGRAREMGAERMLYLGLYLAHDLLRAPVPAGVLQRVTTDGAVRSLGAQVRAEFFRKSRTPPGVARRVLFRMRMRGNAWEGVRYVFCQSTAHTQEDWSLARMSPALAPLDGALRPFRLLRKYGLGGTSGPAQRSGPKK